MMETRFRNRYRIPSARLPGWDYTAAGVYFITICTRERIPYLGEIQNDEIHLSDLGGVARQFWVEIPNHFPNVILDEFVIMPNHVHGIIVINSPGDVVDVETQHAASLHQQQRQQHQQNQQPTASLPRSTPKPGSISAIIRSYKSAVTRWAGQNGHANFAWQARFYDHIVRNQKSLENIQRYILRNPEKWDTDDYNPKKLAMK